MFPRCRAEYWASRESRDMLLEDAEGLVWEVAALGELILDPSLFGEDELVVVAAVVGRWDAVRVVVAAELVVALFCLGLETLPQPFPLLLDQLPLESFL